MNKLGHNGELEVAGPAASTPLRESVREALAHYFARLDGHAASGLFDLVFSEVESVLLEVVLDHSDGNLSRAANMLGINRATLRKKLKRYGLD